MKIKNYFSALFIWFCLFTTHTHSQNHLFKIASSTDLHFKKNATTHSNRVKPIKEEKEEQEAGSHLTLYFRDADEMLYIKEIKSYEEVQIRDLFGQLKFRGLVKNQLDVSFLISGVYVFESPKHDTVMFIKP
ncbi:hypothetical protein N9M49_01375 [Flavicella sp.]|nr:hypothetical protein [Flavicella sp.]